MVLFFMCRQKEGLTLVAQEKLGAGHQRGQVKQQELFITANLDEGLLIVRFRYDLDCDARERMHLGDLNMGGLLLFISLDENKTERFNYIIQ